MRTELLALILLTKASLAAAEPDAVTIRSERALYVNEASTLTIQVELPDDAAEPLLLTVYAEGTALEVVRGRVSRENARASTQTKLAFAIPVVGRAAGSSVVRAHVRFFRCVDTCRAATANAAVVVDVRAR